MPAIFLDVVRFALIAIGVGLIFAHIWGANVGGLFTALGITSIVIGLTLRSGTWAELCRADHLRAADAASSSPSGWATGSRPSGARAASPK